jgi:hypothetical protein
MTENGNLDQGRVFHITFAYNFNKQLINPGGSHADIEIDLTIRHSRGILTVDDPVEISGKAILQPIAQNVTSLTMYFDNAQEYPPNQNTEGFTKGADLILNRTRNSNTLTGNVNVSWALEGTYHPLLAITRNLNRTHHEAFVAGQAPGVSITVYPKSQSAQIITNKATLLLTLAAYVLALIGAFNIIYDLWGRNPSLQNGNNPISQNDDNNRNKTNSEPRPHTEKPNNGVINTQKSSNQREPGRYKQ